MDDSSGLSVHRTVYHQSQRLFWNEVEHRPRAPIRLSAAFLLFLILAGAGNQYRPALLTGDGAILEVINMLTRQLPNALGLGLAVVVAAVLVDRRRLTDLGLNINLNWWRGLVGGTVLGGGITLLTIVVGLGVGYYEFAGIQLTTRPSVWVLVAVGAALFQLLFVVPEELFVRGYVITNIMEGLNGISSVSRRMAAGIGIVVSSGFFYLTHAAAKGTVFGFMIAVLSLLLGLGYVLSGDLSVPIGIHFGANFTGVLAGMNPQHTSLFEITAATTVQESIVLPSEAVIIRMVGAVFAIGVLVWWYHTSRGRLQIDPTITQPVLRWQDSRNSTDD